MHIEGIKHVWFDLAGTLYKETPEFNEVHNQFRYQTYAKLQGITNFSVAKKEFLDLYQKYGSNSAVFRALGQPSNYWMRALDAMDFTAVLHPDFEVTQTLANLKDIVPISLFTNFPKDRIVGLLAHLDIPAAYFTTVLTGDDILECKPALDGFYAMIEHSGLSASQILYVGDRIDVDIKPAKSVGIKTCLLYGKSDEADFSLDNFSAILRLFMP
jgi:FMN phosphatase YigB (HAD superfamily)